MDSPATREVQQCSNTSKIFSVLSLFDQGIAYFQQEQYAEGMSLLTLVEEYLTPGQAHLATAFSLLKQEYAKYSHLQEALQELSNRLSEIQSELQTSKATLVALCPMLFALRNGESLSALPNREHNATGYASQGNDDAKPTLYAICLGPFEVRHLGVPIALCTNRNGQTLFRYLIAQADHSATTDTLMALLWPTDPVEVAMRKLQVTVSILRRSLSAGVDLQTDYILYKQHVYQLNPAIPLGSDVDEFLALYSSGHKESGDVAAAYYEKACALYTRPFLVEDLYADWSFMRREQLRKIRQSMCSGLVSHYLKKQSYEKAEQWAIAIIEENSCDEAAYQMLMRIYALQGKRNDALRQYQRCQQVLLNELGMQPMSETEKLAAAIARGDLTPGNLGQERAGFGTKHEQSARRVSNSTIEQLKGPSRGGS